jgi:hypothetical protein
MDIILQPFAVFVQHPERSALVAVLFLALWLLVRSRRSTTRRTQALLIPAVAWGLYAVWEWALTHWSPEANIRVALLVIIPLLLLATIIGIVMALRERAH